MSTNKMNNKYVAKNGMKVELIVAINQYQCQPIFNKCKWITISLFIILHRKNRFEKIQYHYQDSPFLL